MRRIALVVTISVAAVCAQQPADAATFTTTTNSFSFGQAPDWMPNGQVAWHDDVTGENQVYVSNLDGSAKRCLSCAQKGPNMVAQARHQGDWVLFHPWSGHNLTIGSPGFGRMGSSLIVVDPRPNEIVQLT